MSVLFVISALFCLQHAHANVAVFDIALDNLYLMQQGIGWPHTLHVVSGHEALLKLNKKLEHVDKCEIITAQGAVFDLDHLISNRFEAWGDDGCGLRVKNINNDDRGRWRLTASNSSHSLTGWIEIHVQDDISHYSASPITLQDGASHATVSLTTLSNSYCLVSQPFSDSNLVPGQCNITLDRTTRAVQGNWHVLLGLPGRVSELEIDRTVAVESERIESGFLHETNPNKLHIYCNIRHTAKNITFCRFQKTTSVVGVNVMDGLSDGVHSYYGDGFAQKHCGVTIENPTDADYATWRCTVGVQEWSGTHIMPSAPLQALIRVVSTSSRRKTINKVLRETTEVRTEFVQRDATFSISCQAEASLSYCWFQHPNSSQFTPVDKVDDNQLFWYSGESLSTGNCGITFTHVTDEDAGIWTCHMGPRDQVGIEFTDQVNVRVTGALAAREEDVTGVIGESTTLYCHSSNGNRALQYCRFLTPHRVGISLDSSVTEEEAVMGRYFFTPDRHLDYGDCSLTISPVSAEDMGEWTCAALVDDETEESRDKILLHVEITPRTRRLRAGGIGMGVGIAILVVAFAVVVTFKNRHRIPWRRHSNTLSSPTDMISLESRSNASRTSNASGDSNNSNGSDSSSQIDVMPPRSGLENLMHAS